MKKWLISGVVLVLGGVAAIQFTGRIFTQEVDQFLVNLAKDPRMEVVALEQHSGWLRSEGEVTLAIDMDARQELIITNRWDARHRPGWVSYQGETQLASQEEGQSPVDLLAAIGLEALPFTGRAGWRQANYQLQLQPLSLQEEGWSIEFSGGQLEADYVYSSGQQSGHLQADLIQLASGPFNPTQLTFDDLSLHWEQQGVYPWISGNLEAHLEKLSWQGPQGELQLIQPQGSQSLAFSEEAFALELGVDTGRVQTAGRDLGQLRLQVETQDFDGMAMADLLDFFGQQADWEALSEEAMQPGLKALNQLLKGSPGIQLKQLEVDLVAPIEVSQGAEGSLQFDGTNLPDDYLNRLSRGEIAEDDFIQRFKLELLVDQIDPDLLLLVGIPAFLQDESKAQQRITWQAGELRLNGQRLPF